MSTKEEKALWRRVKPRYFGKSIMDLIERSGTLTANAKKNLKTVLFWGLRDQLLLMAEIIEFYGLND